VPWLCQITLTIAGIAVCVRVVLIGFHEKLLCRNGTSVQPLPATSCPDGYNDDPYKWMLYDTEHGSAEDECRCWIVLKQYRHGSSWVIVDNSSARLSCRRSFVSEAHTTTSFSLRTVRSTPSATPRHLLNALCVEVLRGRAVQMPRWPDG
jgi:hypothetical protein